MGRKIRIPFQPLDYNSRHLAEPMELIINYINGRSYVRNEAGTDDIELLAGPAVLEYVRTQLESVLDGVTTEHNTLEKLKNSILELKTWKDGITQAELDETVNTITQILEKFADMRESDQTLVDLLAKKQPKETGKQLSRNDFTIVRRDKLVKIAPGSNKYTHPSDKFCNYEAPVISVNGKQGPVMLNKNDIPGMENVDPEANNYDHPQTQQCLHIFAVQKVNGQSGDVVITKSDVGLSMIQNLGPEWNDGVGDDKYLPLTNAYNRLAKRVEDRIKGIN